MTTIDSPVLLNLLNEIDEILAERSALRERVKELEAQPFNNRPKLSQQEVKDIRAAHRGGMTQIDLANSYGVNPSTISRIVRGFYH